MAIISVLSNNRTGFTSELNSHRETSHFTGVVTLKKLVCELM